MLEDGKYLTWNIWRLNILFFKSLVFCVLNPWFTVILQHTLVRAWRSAASCASFFFYASVTHSWWHFYPSAASQSHLLPQFLMDGGCISIPQHLYTIHSQAYGGSAEAHLVPRPVAESTSHAQQNGEPRFDDTVTVEAAVRHVDSSSLSEDDVFYN